MTCGKCGRAIPDDWQFCMYCGAKAEKPIEHACPRCGNALRPGSLFCSRCGQRLGGGPAPQPACAPPRKKGLPALAWWIGGGTLALAAASVLIVLLLPGGKPPAGAAATREPTKAAALESTRAPKTAKPTPEPTPQPVITPRVAPDTSKAVELQWYMFRFGDPYPDEGMVLSRVNDYLLGKINARVNVNSIEYSNYDTTVNMMLASGQPFDLLFTSSWSADFLNNSKAGYLHPLDSLVPDYGADIFNTLGPDRLRAASVGGKLYAIPSFGAPYHTYGLMLRSDLVNKYGIKTGSLHSLEDFGPVFAKITKGEPGVYPLLIDSSSDPYDLLDWDKPAYNVPGALYSNNGAPNVRILNDYAAPESVALFKTMRGFYESGYIDPASAGRDDFYGDVKTDKYFAFVYSAMPGDEAYEKESSGQEWISVRLTPPVTRQSDCTGSMTSIPAASRNPERAMMFCNLLYKDEYLLGTLYYGVEGVHYTKLSGNTIRQENLSGYNPAYTWMFGNPMLSYLPEDAPADKWLTTEREARASLKLNTLGFWFDDSRVTSQISACRSVVEQYYNNLISGAGQGSVDSIVAAFTGDLAGAGMDGILAEMQSQYDAWRAGGN